MALRTLTLSLRTLTPLFPTSAVADRECTEGQHRSVSATPYPPTTPGYSHDSTYLAFDIRRAEKKQVDGS